MRREGTAIVYRYGMRPPVQRPLKPRTYGDVTTLRQVLFDHVCFEGEALMISVAGQDRCPTEYQVREIYRVSRKPHTKPRVHCIYDILHHGLRVATARSWADVHRRLGVDLPKVIASTVVAPKREDSAMDLSE
jgi:hypothetical protein